MTEHGTLGLSTPWARGAIRGEERAEIESLIPPGWTVGVAANRPGSYIVWLNRGTTLVEKLNYQHDAGQAARWLALKALGLDVAEHAVGEWTERDGYVVAPLDWKGAK